MRALKVCVFVIGFPPPLKHPVNRDLKILGAIKKQIAKLSQERKVALVIDLHAHSRRCNVFSYGCRPSKGLVLADQQVKESNRKTQGREIECSTWPPLTCYSDSPGDLSGCFQR